MNENKEINELLIRNDESSQESEQGDSVKSNQKNITEPRHRTASAEKASLSQCVNKMASNKITKPPGIGGDVQNEEDMDIDTGDRNIDSEERIFEE